jgi:xylono-1,5-lactonase
MPEPIRFIVPRRKRPGFIAGFQSGFYSIELEPFIRHLIGSAEPNLPNNRLKGGKVDSRGRLFAGTMPINGDAPSGSLYQMNADHSCQVVNDGYYVSNGAAFSPSRTSYSTLTVHNVKFIVLRLMTQGCCMTKHPL